MQQITQPYLILNMYTRTYTIIGVLVFKDLTLLTEISSLKFAILISMLLINKL
jgi:hypothetical protein